ncbi:MAG: DeoR/GlpR family DNA-binding transcription regulator [Thermaceae bacterium]|nr:DeoR/GlpR family DNA-binding transcription regulator [Thermaceae bacterium]
MILEASPLPGERQREILRLALLVETVRVSELAERLGVHEMTIRRDLEALVAQGLLERVHGGARRTQKTGLESAYAQRIGQNAEAKGRIARAALRLISEGDTVGMDSSTTALALAGLLGTVKATAVVTGLDAANALAGANVPFLLAGGSFHALARSFVGGLQRELLSRLRIDKVFFSAKAWSPAQGFSDVHLPDVEAKQALIAAGRCVIALLDSSKLEQEAFCQIVPTAGVQVLVTDREPSRAVREAFEEADVQVIVAEGEAA